MLSSNYYSCDYELGDLVVLVHSIEWLTMCIECGEIGIIVKLYDRSYDSCHIYDCRVRLKCGGELDVWFGEIESIKNESCS